MGKQKGKEGLGLSLGRATCGPNGCPTCPLEFPGASGSCPFLAASVALENSDTRHERMSIVFTSLLWLRTGIAHLCSVCLEVEAGDGLRARAARGVQRAGVSLGGGTTTYRCQREGGVWSGRSAAVLLLTQRSPGAFA